MRRRRRKRSPPWRYRLGTVNSARELLFRVVRPLDQPDVAPTFDGHRADVGQTFERRPRDVGPTRVENLAQALVWDLEFIVGSVGVRLDRIDPETDPASEQPVVGVDLAHLAMIANAREHLEVRRRIARHQSRASSTALIPSHPHDRRIDRRALYARTFA